MNRRQLVRNALLISIAPTLAQAQDRPVEGKHYRAVSPRQPTRDPRQVEVVEFFAYSCSHCHSFEPLIEPWQRKLPAGAYFRRLPVAFRENLAIHQRLYYAIEVMGLMNLLHPKVFAALHQERRSLNTNEEVGAFVASHGVDRAKFVQTMDSFGVVSMVKQANALVAGYRIDGTPSIGVDGRWLTSGSLAGSNPESLRVAEHLIGLAKKAS